MCCVCLSIFHLRQTFVPAIETHFLSPVFLLPSYPFNYLLHTPSNCNELSQVNVLYNVYQLPNHQNLDQWLQLISLLMEEQGPSIGINCTHQNVTGQITGRHPSDILDSQCVVSIFPQKNCLPHWAWKKFYYIRMYPSMLSYNSLLCMSNTQDTIGTKAATPHVS